MDILPVLEIRQFGKEEIQADFYANTVSEHLQTGHKHLLVPHKHNFYLTILFTAGIGIHEVDFDSFEVKKGSVFMLNPGQTHFWRLSEDIEGVIFFHSESFYQLQYTNKQLSAFPFFYSVRNSPCIYLSDNQCAEVESLFQSILQEYRSNDLYRIPKITSLVDCLYIDLSRIYLSAHVEALHGRNGYSQKIKRLEELIDQYFREEKSAGKYAEMMHMSAKHLNRIVRESLNKTTTELIAERTMLEARRLLSHSDLTLTAIAEYLGYDEYAYFSRFFKKHDGESPLEFSRKYQL